MNLFINFVEIDPLEEGLIVLIVGLVVVFSSLLILYTVFAYVVPATLRSLRTIKLGYTTRHETSTPEDIVQSGEEMAAIAATIYLLLNQSHDEENAILTISKSQKDYSPWSSKIYMTHNVKPTQR